MIRAKYDERGDLVGSSCEHLRDGVCISCLHEFVEANLRAAVVAPIEAPRFLSVEEAGAWDRYFSDTLKLAAIRGVEDFDAAELSAAAETADRMLDERRKRRTLQGLLEKKVPPL